MFFNYPSFARVSLPGDYMPGATPVPIPNTAVKPRAANGSRTIGPARVGCCQVYGPDASKEVSGPSFLLSSRFQVQGSPIIILILVIVIVQGSLFADKRPPED